MGVNDSMTRPLAVNSDICTDKNQPQSTSCDTSSFPEAGMSVSREELSSLPLTILGGDLPTDIRGHVFIIGPTGTVNSPTTAAVFPSGSGTSLFNGDGMVYRLDFDQKRGASLTSRMIKTPCYYADAASVTGTQYANLGFLNAGLARLSPILGFRNELNTAFLPIKFAPDLSWRLLVTWDAGRPYEIDPVTLKLITPIGRDQEWQEQKVPLRSGPFLFKLCLSGAHPAFDHETHQLFMVNWGKSLLSLLSPVLVHGIATLLRGNGLLKQLFRWIFWLIQGVFRLLQVSVHLLGGNSKDFVDLICWDGSGDLQKWRVLHPNGTPVFVQETMHQIGVTRDYIVLMDTAFKLGPEQILPNPLPGRQSLETTFRDLFDTPLPADTAVYLVDRAALKPEKDTVVAQKVSIPREIAHFLTDYDNEGGKITLHAAHNCAWDPAEWLHDYDRYPPEGASSNPAASFVSHDRVGMTVGTMDINYVARHIIDTKTGTLADSSLVSDSSYTWATAIYAAHNLLQPNHYQNLYWLSWGCWQDLLTEYIYDLYSPYKYRTIDPQKMLEITRAGKPSNLCRFDLNKLAIVDGYTFPDGYFGNSPQFIPRTDPAQKSSTNGYLTCVVLTTNRPAVNNSEIWIFEAADLQKGPVCKLADPSGRLKIGLTIHTTWLPEIARPEIHYQVPAREDYDPLIDQQPPELQQEIRALFEKEIYPNFENN